MSKFYNTNDLCKYVQKKIDDALCKDVSESVTDSIVNSVQEVVYAVYNPVMYARRGINGGLADRRNIKCDLIGPGILEAENVTPFNGRNDYADTLSEVIISGSGYMYHPNAGVGEYERPRDFISESKEDLLLSKKHILALKKGLRRNGIRTN